DRVTVMLQIEHIDAVPRVEEIVTVPGVDAIIVGPYDLSASMGLPGQIAHPKVTAAADSLAAACRDHRMPWGAFSPNADSALAQRERGASLFAAATDTMYLWQAARETLAKLSNLGSR